MLQLQGGVLELKTFLIIVSHRSVCFVYKSDAKICLCNAEGIPLKVYWYIKTDLLLTVTDKTFAFNRFEFTQT